ncbi:coiled-coil domain-containing protein [Propionibacterium australiense]|uniref:coiled-coil domain-containing protein n=1 Tax=Propionibacterium australiense TaxID=119981 RepID=UPI000F8310A7|nr:hypothetical protein [Propionibacterium australiense]
MRAALSAAVASVMFLAQGAVEARADDLDDQFAALQDKIASSSGTVSDSYATLDAAMSALTASRDELSAAQQTAEKAQKAADEAQRDADAAAEALSTAQDNRKAAQAQVDEAQTQVDGAKQELGMVASQAAQQNTGLTGIALLVGDGSTSQISNRVQWANQSFSATQAKVAAYQSALDELSAKRDALVEAENDAQAARDKAVDRLAAAQEASQAAADAAAAVQEKLDANQAALAAAQDIVNEAVASDDALKRQANDLASQIQARDAAAAAAAAETAAAANRANAAAGASWLTTNIAPGQLTPYSVDQAVATAQAMEGDMRYGNMCLALVAAFYGYSSSGVNSATDAAATIMAAGQMQYDTSNIPVGALVWYDGAPAGNPFGHVAMYAGNGMIYSNGAANGGVGVISLDTPSAGWGEPLIGWSSVWLPNATG